MFNASASREGLGGSDDLPLRLNVHRLKKCQTTETAEEVERLQQLLPTYLVSNQ